MWGLGKGMSIGGIHAPVTEGRGPSGHKSLGTFHMREFGVKSSNHIFNRDQT